MWIEQKTLPWRRAVPKHPEYEKWRLRVCLLRARMLAFVQQILAFATFEVLEPNWRTLEAKLDKVTTVDQLLRDHVDFLDTCLKECMLTSAKLLKVRSAPSPPFRRLTYIRRMVGILKAGRDLLDICALCIVVHQGRELGYCCLGKSRRRP